MTDTDKQNIEARNDVSSPTEGLQALEKAGGLILEQLESVNAITPAQKDAILAQQSAIEAETGKKPFVGELLEEAGIDTRGLKQPLLDLQASARALLASKGQSAALSQAEGGYGNIDLKAGVEDNKWTKQDIASGDPAKEQTAKLQTQLLQTKVLAKVADTLESSGLPIPEQVIDGLRAAQDQARIDFGKAIIKLEALGQDTRSLEAAYNALPVPDAGQSIQGQNNAIASGIASGTQALEQNSLLTQQEASRLLGQTQGRHSDISTVVAKQEVVSAQVKTSGARTATESQQQSWASRAAPPTPENTQKRSGGQNR